MFSITVLISGGGTTLKNLIDVQKSGGVNWQIDGIICNNPTAKGLQFAAANNIQHAVVDHRNFDSEQEFSDAVYDAIKGLKTKPDLIVMGGFLRKLNIADDYRNKIINIHPSLIPSFCGKGNYGLRVHQAVIDYGCKLTGCTVHFVDDQYDHGPIIAQRAVAVENDDTASTLASRVFDTECQLFPEVISKIASGKVSISDRAVRIDSACEN
jgi:phosphoribosylglycinamide formyltransferase-1